MVAMMKKLMCSKKGTVLEIIMTPTFTTAVVLGIVLIGMLTRINAIGDTKTFEKKFIAIDLALAIDALQAARGNAFIIFMQDSNFSIDISKNTVLVFDGEKLKDKTAGIYYFFEQEGTGGVGIGYTTFGPADRASSSILLSKQGNSIVFGSMAGTSNFKPNLEAIACERPANLPTLKSIAVDYEHNQDAAAANETAKEIQGGFSQTATHIDAQTINERKNQAADKDGVISIILNRNTVAQLETAKVYINENSNKKQQSIFLACNILNSLSNKYRLAGASIVPVDLSHLSAEDSRNLLFPNSVAVVIELNINQAGTIDNTKELANTIYNGIKAYQTA